MTAWASNNHLNAEEPVLSIQSTLIILLPIAQDILSDHRPQIILIIHNYIYIYVTLLSLFHTCWNVSREMAAKMAGLLVPNEKISERRQHKDLRHMKIDTQLPAAREAKAREMMGNSASLKDRQIMGMRFVAGAPTTMTPASFASLSENTSAPMILKCSSPRTVFSSEPMTLCLA